MKKFRFEFLISLIIIIILLQPIYAIGVLKHEKELNNLRNVSESIWKRDPEFMKLQEKLINKFPTKNYSVKLLSEIEYRIFGESKNVIIGLDGYLSDKVVARQLLTLDETDLISLRESAVKLSKIDRYLSKKNKKFIVVVIPLKPTLYKEKYPGPLAKRQGVALLKFQQQLNDLGVEYIDLYEPMLANKKIHELFYKTDFHWNTAGSAVAAKEIVDYLSKQYYGAKIFNENFESSKELFVGVESNSMSLIKPISENSEKYLSTTLDYKIVQDKPWEVFTSTNMRKSLLPKTLMFGNSFMLYYRYSGMQNYFKEFTEILDYTDFKNLSKYVNNEEEIVILNLYETQILFHLIEGDQSLYWPQDVLGMNF